MSYDHDPYKKHAADVAAFCQENPGLFAAVHALEIMTDEERRAVFGLYCRECGCTDTHCQCWNDD